VRLDDDPHAAECPTCHDRIRAARLLLAVLAAPPATVPFPAGLTESILAGVRTDRRARSRRRILIAAGGFAAAAAVVLAVWLGRPGEAPRPPIVPSHETVRQEPEPAPAPRPARIGPELAKAGGALLDTSRAIAEPATSAPRVFASLADVLTPPPVQPMDGDLGQVRLSLAEIPEVARAGLEPVTDSAQKAFARLIRDVSAVRPNPQPKPKS
jgi:hypothetical protein